MKDGILSDLKSPRQDLGRGKPLDPDEPRTLADLFVNAANKHPEINFLNFKRDGRWQPLGSAEMIRRMENCALGLYSLGLRKGDRVAILAPNSPEWTIADAGCQFAGIVDRTDLYNSRFGIGGIYSERFRCPDLVSRGQGSYEDLKEIIRQSPSIEKVVLFRGEETDQRSTTFEQLLGSGSELRSSGRSDR